MSPELQSKDLTAEQFRQFGEYIRNHSGIHLEDSKRDPLRISLITRATRWGCTSFDEYFEMLFADESEFDELLNLITINETSFFRFAAQFDALRNTVIPAVLESKPRMSRSFRVWSAGCSTGEEPYSVAMTLIDSPLLQRGYRPEVLGTDVSTQALDRARTAFYPAKALANLPEDLVRRNYEPEGSGYHVAAHVREIVDFSYHNLVKEPYPIALAGNWDVIFCRNVTIYFHLEATRRVIENFFDSLNPGGFLFLGHSETLTSISDRFDPVEADGVFLYRKPELKRVHRLGVSRARKASPQNEVGLGDPSAGARGGLSPMEPRSAVVPQAGGALRAARRVPDPDPGVETVHALVAAARLRLSEGSAAVALKLAREALEHDPRNVDAFLLAAYAHADAGDFAAALEECRRTLAINPLVAAARFILGIIYLRLDDPMRAIAEFKRTLYIDSEFVLARFHLANLYRSRGSVDDACREYENTLRSLARNPQGDWTLFLDGFTPDVLAGTSERALTECRRLAVTS